MTKPYEIKLTPHEAWEKMSAYFGQKGARLAVTSSGVCLYRTPAGRACAVGCLLPDDVAEHADEIGADGGWSDIVSLVHCEFFTFTHEDTYRFLRDAQAAHDTAGLRDGGGVRAFRRWLKENEPEQAA